MDLISMALGAVLTGVGATLGRLLTVKGSSHIKWESPDMEYIKQELKNLDCNERRRSAEIKALFKLQEPQIKASIALLETFKHGKTNGNIDKAISDIREAEEKFHQFLVEGVGKTGKEEGPG